MGTLFKIRLLLFLITLGFTVTAVTLHFTFNKNEILELDAKTIEYNLHKKEKFVKDFLNNKKNFDALRTIHKNPGLASDIIEQFRDRKALYLHTYYNHQLVFWGANRIAPTTDGGLKEGSNRIKTQNGWYEAIKKSSGNFSAVCIIPIKADYPFQNKFLKNTFAPDLIKDNNLDIAGLTDKRVYNIRNSDGRFVISVKLKSSVTNTFYSKLELWTWILAGLFCTVFINYWCVSLARRGYIKWASAVFFVYFLALRMLTLQYPLLDTYFNLSIFDPRHFSDGYFFRSLGDFLLSALFSSWFMCFIFSYRHEIRLSEQPLSTRRSTIIFGLLGVILCLICYQMSDLFYLLIIRSSINFDLTNILNLDAFSWVGILLLYMAAFNLYLILETILAVGKTLRLSNKQRFQIFAGGVLLLLVVQLLAKDYGIYVIFFSAIVLLRGYAYYTNNTAHSFLIFLLTILLFSIIASIKLSYFQFIKEREQRKILAYKLESADDPNAVLLFFSLEQEILKDDYIIDYFKQARPNKEELQEKLKKLYFDGYLSRYTFETYTYSPVQTEISGDSVSINTFKNLVIAGSIKVSENFYRINNTFGYQHYFAILPVQENGNLLGTLILTLKSKTFRSPRSVPEVLVDSKMNTDKELENYSFAFYLNGHLLNQNGNYIYNLINNDFRGETGAFTFVEKGKYNHLIYKPNEKKVIVVSLPVTTWIAKLASVSFLFLVMIFLSIMVTMIHQAWTVLHDDQFRFNENKWAYLLSKNKILYRTRIQASLVAAIVFTLLIVGLITYYSISNQFRRQLQDDLLAQITQINNGLESNKMFNDGRLTSNEQTLHAFADINASDLALFDLNGRLLFTTQSKIYDQGLIEPRMNALAYIYLNKYQRSEYLNSERIGRMRFIAAYQPIRNSRNETVAYLSVPYFANESDYDTRIGQYLNTLINVYALVLVVIALFAIFLANQITYPLTLVGKSLSEIKIDGKNEPIRWNSNDEIGSLIREYNNMIVALEESAKKLARSERESAWREMAKQVAHEIKNPLTPLKLGVQLLEKSWKENDPNFNRKFEKFSKSFIEQIESLSLIASEFSNFAKLPDTPFERLNVTEIIEKSIEVYNKSYDVEILFSHPDRSLFVNGSKDHLLRTFNNLIKNAVEAIPAERKGHIGIILTHTDQDLFIEVNDNGNGISEELKEKIFNPNFTTKSSGTGLGLAFVKQAIENMLGSITFETHPGNGTSFFIRLPLA